mmetsp:Transcript_9910/g.14804  ORF Transcript_9910/g.14804 Transcript_9910/m.14804 type:complete len:408 (-) Transcript_9910:386-1609(-)
MQSKLRCLPLLEGLEDKRDGTHVGNVQSLQDGCSLLVILRGGSSNKGESSKIDDSVNNRLAHAIFEVLLNGSREVKSTRVDGDNTCSTAFQLSDQGDVVSVILGVDVRLLKNDTNSWCGLRINTSIGAELIVVPVEVTVVGFEDDIGSNRVPDSLIGKKDGLFHNNLLLSNHSILNGSDVILTNHEQKRLEILRRSSKPVLEGHHESTSISSLVTGKELQHLRKSTKKLQHTLLERRSIILLLLLHEISNNTLRLSKIFHCEGSNLIQTHNLGHGRENQNSIQLISQWLNDLSNLLSKLLHEDKRSNEDISIGNILLKLFKCLIIPQLLQQVTNSLNSHVVRSSVDTLSGSSHGRLILRFEHNVDDLHGRTVTNIFGDDAARFRIRCCEHTSTRTTDIGGIGDDHVK